MSCYRAFNQCRLTNSNKDGTPIYPALTNQVNIAHAGTHLKIYLDARLLKFTTSNEVFTTVGSLEQSNTISYYEILSFHPIT